MPDSHIDFCRFQRFLLEPTAPSVTRFNAELYGLDGASHLVQFYAAAAYRELRAADVKLKRLQGTGLSAGKESQVFSMVPSSL